MRNGSVVRLIDANANRALEGMRVVEDIVRFDLGPPRAVRRIRALRHGIAGAIDRLPLRTVDLVRARASARDPGRRAPASRVD